MMKNTNDNNNILMNSVVYSRQQPTVSEKPTPLSRY